MFRDTDRLFDRDGDGELDFFEQVERDVFEEELIREMNGESEEDDLFSDDDDDI